MRCVDRRVPIRVHSHWLRHAAAASLLRREEGVHVLGHVLEAQKLDLHLLALAVEELRAQLRRAIDLANALYRRSIAGRFTWTGTRLFEFLRVRGVLDLYGLPRDAGALNNRDIFAVFRTDFERRVAFAMALHPRLGVCSAARCCDPLIVSLILASPLCPVRPASFVWDVSPSTSSDESE